MMLVIERDDADDDRVYDALVISLSRYARELSKAAGWCGELLLRIYIYVVLFTLCNGIKRATGFFIFV